MGRQLTGGHVVFYFKLKFQSELSKSSTSGYLLSMSLIDKPCLLGLLGLMDVWHACESLEVWALRNFYVIVQSRYQEISSAIEYVSFIGFICFSDAHFLKFRYDGVEFLPVIFWVKVHSVK